MKRNALVIVLAGSALALAAWQLVAAGGSDSAASAPALSSASATPEASVAATGSAPVAGAGYVVHFDESGRVMEEPTAESIAELNAKLAQAINTSSEGLVEQASPVSGGGMMIDLQGRFQTSAAASVDASGKLIVPCLGNEAEVDAFTSSPASFADTKE